MTFNQAITKIEKNPNFLGMNITNLEFEVSIDQEAQNVIEVNEGLWDSMEFEDIKMMSQMPKFKDLIVWNVAISKTGNTYEVSIGLELEK